MYTTVNDLLERLQELEEEGYGDAKLRIAYQPNWPLASFVENVRTVDDADRYDDEQDMQTVWIAASNTVWGENPYAPREAWEEEW